jgi:hypothetical protein
MPQEACGPRRTLSQQPPNVEFDLENEQSPSFFSIFKWRVTHIKWKNAMYFKEYLH